MRGRGRGRKAIAKRGERGKGSGDVRPTNEVVRPARLLRRRLGFSVRLSGRGGSPAASSSSGPARRYRAGAPRAGPWRSREGGARSRGGFRRTGRREAVRAEAVRAETRRAETGRARHPT